MDDDKPELGAAAPAGSGDRSDPDRAAAPAPAADQPPARVVTGPDWGPDLGPGSEPKRGARARTIAYDSFFDSDRLARYHRYRASFFETWHRLTMFVVLLSGTAALTALIPDPVPAWLPVLMVLPTVLASLDLVIGFSQRASRHMALTAQYTDLHRFRPGDR